jgi:hypothetical protein
MGKWLETRYIESIANAPSFSIAPKIILSPKVSNRIPIKTLYQILIGGNNIGFCEQPFSKGNLLAESSL